MGPSGAPAPPRSIGRARRCCGRRACPCRRWWRSGTATSAATRAPRSGRWPARRAAACPGRRPRPRTASPASGSSKRSARGDGSRGRRSLCRGNRRTLHRTILGDAPMRSRRSSSHRGQPIRGLPPRTPAHPGRRPTPNAGPPRTPAHPGRRPTPGAGHQSQAPSSSTERMPSCASMSSKARLTSSRGIRWEMNGSTSMSPRRCSSTTSGT